VKQALLVARVSGGLAAMTVRDAFRLGTRKGTAVLGRDDIGSLEAGKRADIAVWRTTASSSGARRTCSPGSSSRLRIASTGSTSAARRASSGVSS
jgi:cytosine/adenosine deaminase-related metal-dependent hydrolase